MFLALIPLWLSTLAPALPADPGLSPFCAAMEEGDIEAVRAAVARGTSPKTVCEYEMPALLQAAGDGRRDLAQALIGLGADVQDLGPYGVTTLHAAAGAHRGALATVELLLGHGADPTALDSLGRSPMHVAAGHADPHVVDALLGCGADVNVADMKGSTPLHVAAAPGYTNPGHEAVLQLLLSRGADPHRVDREGRTPLHMANTYAVSHLVHAGIDVDARDSQGWTALHHAAWRCELELVERLLVGGTDPRVKNNDGDNPLELIRKMDEMGPPRELVARLERALKER